MSLELIYTSAPSGLKPGAKGFCTVLMTQGMPPGLVGRLEMLSAYRHVFPPQDPRANQNPTGYSHVKLKVTGQSVSIISRVSAYGVDYSGRTNKFAHHVVLQPGELVSAGPASLLLDQRVMRQDWQGSPQSPAAGPVIPKLERNAAICSTWQRLGGDAGWGGVVAEALSKPTGKPKWIIYSLEQHDQLLRLIEESIALLPVPAKWNATFSTYYTNMPPEADCFLRCVPVGSDEARTVSPRDCIINLASPAILSEQSEWIDAARNGKIVGGSQAALTPESQSFESHQPFITSDTNSLSYHTSTGHPSNKMDEFKQPAANYDVHEDWPFQPTETKGPSLPPPPNVVDNHAGANTYESPESSSLKPILLAVAGALLLLILIGGWFTYTIVNKPIAKKSTEEKFNADVEQETAETPQAANEDSPLEPTNQTDAPLPQPAELNGDGAVPETEPTNTDSPNDEDANGRPKTTTEGPLAPPSNPITITEPGAINVGPGKASAQPTPTPQASTQETPPTSGPLPDQPPSGENTVAPPIPKQVEPILDGTELFLELKENGEQLELSGTKTMKLLDIKDESSYGWASLNGQRPSNEKFKSFDFRNSRQGPVIIPFERASALHLRVGKIEDGENNGAITFVSRIGMAKPAPTQDDHELAGETEKILLGINGFVKQVRELEKIVIMEIAFTNKEAEAQEAWKTLKSSLREFVETSQRQPLLRTDLDSGIADVKSKLANFEKFTKPTPGYVDELKNTIAKLQEHANRVQESVASINKMQKFSLGVLFVRNKGTGGPLKGSFKDSETPIEVTVRIKVDERGTK